MPVQARQFVRKMRGGAQSHLIEASDGHFYVVKFANNPQHRRILVNEWLGSAAFDYLRIQTPAARIIEVTTEFLETHPEVYFQLGASRQAVEPGWHFGSRYPGHPHRLAVYDVLPDQLLGSVHNARDFLAAYVADRWLGNADARQAIFFRAQIREWTGQAEVHPLRKGFLAQSIDHGFLLNGPHWTFPDSPLQGLYFRHRVYDSVTGIDSFEPWLALVENFPVEKLDEAWRGVPPSWLAGDDALHLERLIDVLFRRRKRVADLIRDTRAGRVNPFANWR
jgi:hypothetical protein